MTPTEVADGIMHFWLRQLPDRAQQEVFNILKSTYIGDTQLNDFLIAIGLALESQNAIGFYGPAMFQMNKFVSQASERIHFLYKFSYCTRMSRLCKLGLGPAHADVFDVFMDQQNTTLHNLTSQDTALMHRMTEMCTNFAKTGNPTADWKPYSTGAHNYPR